jgi:HlyD family secretion protein
LQNALAAVRVAEDNLGFTKIFAPESGVISKLSIEKGERVVGTSQMQGTEMLRIANLYNMEVRVDVNENDIIRVSMGDTVEIEVDSYGAKGEKFLGRVTAIANSPNEASLATETITEFEVKIKLLNSSYQHLISKENKYPFKPGMTASVDIITDIKKDVVSVPLSAVTTRTAKDLVEEEKKGRRFGPRSKDSDEKETEMADDDEIKEIVFVYDELKETVKSVEVETGISDFENIRILKGLELGQKIVKGPYLAVSKRLKNDDLVTEKEKDSKRRRD